jgi:hypothetical protein
MACNQTSSLSQAMSQVVCIQAAGGTRHGCLVVIDVPPKVWQPKPKDVYVPPDYANDIDDKHFIF